MRKGQSGFTLVKFYVVVGIILVTALVAAPILLSFTSNNALDITPSSVSNIQPSEPLPSGTVETTVSFDMDRQMPCWLSDTQNANEPYGTESIWSAESEMATHYITVEGLSDGTIFTYDVLCVRMDSNSKDLIFTIDISVEAATN